MAEKMSSEKGAYLLPRLEYVPPVSLPPNSLFDDRDGLKKLIIQTKTSIIGD
jgi:hypothetical protein